ncbi:alanine racemase [Pseudodesulfovibrio sp. F-1]|uniref:Alanine racemase n=1 Tax=Pseudodesulfovibrio alkaliphilus TaxID=2661613 RepID=A0A7K1KP17_9BACT|nr:alanine racemase [Pseudodesulfovibrio alkaliphilus]MUM77797.1 alanine racemase [Pseudodesulfovibrio alkaliphilus]
MIDYNKVRVEISLANLLANVRRFQGVCPTIIPVIKSDAYGHGLAEVARALQGEGIATLAVGFVNEAVALRRSGWVGRILALLGPVDDEDTVALWEHDILAAIANADQLARVAEAARTRGRLAVCLKFDTGMRRLGFRPEALPQLLDALAANPALVPVMASTHLASADMPDREAQVAVQAARFQDVIDVLARAGHRVEANIANSAGGMAHAGCRMDSMRLGIAMYGANPFYGTAWEEKGEGLAQTMQVSAPVLHVHTLARGEGVSYGWTYVTGRDREVAVVGVGYADNYSRSLSNRGFMNIKGHRVPILGRVCMQMTVVDVSRLVGEEGPGVRPGDRAWLLGGPGPGTIAPEELADWWDTIPYEVFCLLGMNPRSHAA